MSEIKYYKKKLKNYTNNNNKWKNFIIQLINFESYEINYYFKSY